MPLNNPAARLHEILTRCRKQDLRPHPMMKAWKSVLGLPDEYEDILAMSKVGKVFTLPRLIGEQIQQYTDLEHELYLGWQKDLAEAFTTVNFKAQFAQFSDKLTDSLLINIRFCSHELAKRKPEKILDEKALAEIKETVHKLYDEVLAARLDADLTRYMLDHLYMIIEAIDDFAITGALGVRTALDAVAGTVLTSTTLAKRTKSSPFGERFWAVVGRIGMLLDLAKTALELGEGLGKVLPEK
jgi:hypothetical protein